MVDIKIVITANGEGSRMKAISPKPKHLLYYGGKRIIDCIVDALKPFGDRGLRRDSGFCEAYICARLQRVF